MDTAAIDLYNPDENNGLYYLTFEFRLADESEQGYEVLFKTGYLAPGKHIYQVNLSHVLSARMSARPMAWSLAGAEKMAKLRAFYFNGGDFSSLTGRKEHTEEKIPKYYRVAFRNEASTDHSIPRGKLSGLEMVYDEFAKILRFIIKK